MKRAYLVALAAALTLAGLAQPAAAGSARVEYVRLTQVGSGSGDAPLQPEAFFGTAEVVTTSTGAAAQSAVAPQVTDRQARPIGGMARVVALSGPLIVANSGTASATNGWRVAEGREAFIPVAAGAHLSLLEDPTAAATPATSCSNCATSAGQTTSQATLTAIDGHVDGLEASTATIATNTTGASTAANQTATQANAGADAGKAVAVQGVTGGKPVATQGDSVDDNATCVGTASSAATLTWTGPAGVCNGLSYISTKGYAAGSIQVVGNAGNNTLRLRGSNDGGTTLSTLNTRASNVTASSACGASFNTATVTYFPCSPPMDRFYADVQTYVSGTVTLSVTLKRVAIPAVVDVNVGNTSVPVIGLPTADASCTTTTVATGGTAVTAQASSTTRKRIVVQNPSATISGVSAEPIYVRFDGTAAIDNTSIELANSAAPLVIDGNAIPTGAISVIAATTGHKFVCKVQ